MRATSLDSGEKPSKRLVAQATPEYIHNPEEAKHQWWVVCQGFKTMYHKDTLRGHGFSWDPDLAAWVRSGLTIAESQLMEQLAKDTGRGAFQVFKGEGDLNSTQVMVKMEKRGQHARWWDLAQKAHKTLEEGLRSGRIGTHQEVPYLGAIAILEDSRGSLADKQRAIELITRLERIFVKTQEERELEVAQGKESTSSLLERLMEKRASGE